MRGWLLPFPHGKGLVFEHKEFEKSRRMSLFPKEVMGGERGRTLSSKDEFQPTVSGVTETDLMLFFAPLFLFQGLTLPQQQ